MKPSYRTPIVLISLSLLFALISLIPSTFAGSSNSNELQGKSDGVSCTERYCPDFLLKKNAASNYEKIMSIQPEVNLDDDEKLKEYATMFFDKVKNLKYRPNFFVGLFKRANLEQRIRQFDVFCKYKYSCEFFMDAIVLLPEERLKMDKYANPLPSVDIDISNEDKVEFFQSIQGSENTGILWAYLMKTMKYQPESRGHHTRPEKYSHHKSVVSLVRVLPSKTLLSMWSSGYIMPSWGRVCLVEKQTPESSFEITHALGEALLGDSHNTLFVFAGMLDDMIRSNDHQDKIPDMFSCFIESKFFSGRDLVRVTKLLESHTFLLPLPIHIPTPHYLASLHLYSAISRWVEKENVKEQHAWFTVEPYIEKLKSFISKSPAGDDTKSIAYYFSKAYFSDARKLNYLKELNIPSEDDLPKKIPKESLTAAVEWFKSTVEDCVVCLEPLNSDAGALGEKDIGTLKTDLCAQCNSAVCHSCTLGYYSKKPMDKCPTCREVLWKNRLTQTDDY